MNLINRNIHALLDCYEFPNDSHRFHELVEHTGKPPKTVSENLRHCIKHGYIRIVKRVYGIKREINLYILTGKGFTVKAMLNRIREETN